MIYQKDRDEFIGQIVTEVMAKGGTNNEGVDLARAILRNASTIQSCEEKVCSSEAADRDRVQCPAIKSGKDSDCCCDCYDWTLWFSPRKWTQFKTEAEALAVLSSNPRPGAIISQHCDTPRVQTQILKARQRIDKACEKWGIKPNHSGDPRGCCVKLILPSGRYNSWGGAEDGFCVPTR